MPNERKHLAPAVEGWIGRNKLTFRKAFGDCALLEYKMLRGKSMPLNGIRPSQRTYMPRGAGEGLVVKIPDSGFAERIPAPCDAVFVSNSSALLVFWIYSPGQRMEKREVWWIHVSDWLGLEDEARRMGKKSVKADRIRDVGVMINVFA